jgi:catechol 2,3-dioxygenase-like lactoylglutathione lyase family enzyme
MKLQRGRLVDHIHLHANDLKATQTFYGAILATLGIDVQVDDTHLAAYELWIDGEAGNTNIHIAFQADDRETVDRFHAAGLAAGGRDNGPPGERPYHPGYYAAFLLDPDGNNIEAVHHGPADRSAKSIEIQFGD